MTNELLQEVTSSKVRARGFILTGPIEFYNEEDTKKALAQYDYALVAPHCRSKDGYNHYHIYVENKQAIRFDTLKARFSKCHIEKRLGTKKQAFDYVHKNPPYDSDGETLVLPTFELGSLSFDELTKKKTIEDFRNAILDGADSSQLNEDFAGYCARYPNYKSQLTFAENEKKYLGSDRPVSVFWLVGSPGVGKTSYIFRNYSYKDVYSVTDYNHPFDEYDGQDVLLLDDYSGEFNFTFLLRLLDKYPLKLSCRYFNKVACFTKVYITSNKMPAGYYYGDLKALYRRISYFYEFTGFDTYKQFMPKERQEFLATLGMAMNLPF